MFERVIELEKNSGVGGVLNRHVGTIDSPDEAAGTVKKIAVGFYWLAGIQAILGYYLAGPLGLVDGLLIAGLAFCLHRWRSRLAAIVLFLMAALIAIQTVLNFLHVGEHNGGTNIFLAVIIVAAALRAVQATFRFHRQWPPAGSTSSTSQPPEAPHEGSP